MPHFSTVARFLLLKWCALCMAVTAAGLCAAQAMLQDLDEFPRTLVEIRSGAERHEFDVWVADTPARQAQGLMFVRDLAADRGMLFIHHEPRMASMWMKNTYIELDMLFIDPDGRIVKIAERTTPHSLDSIHSEVPVRAVLELKGGEAAKRGLRVGDRVTWKR